MRCRQTEKLSKVRHGGIGLCEYLLNPYILNIRTRIRTNHLSLFRISPKRQERLDDIYRLHKEGKSTKEITDFMNQKYGTTLRTNRPYYPQLIWVSLDKYKKHKKRLLEEETIKEVYFDYVDIKKTKLPKEFITKKDPFIYWMNKRQQKNKPKTKLTNLINSII